MSLLTMPDDAFTRAVSDAFRQYDSTLKLSRSPLAALDLIGPALVLDDVAPTPDERGRAVRVVLRWAVARLAPSPPRFPPGTPRSFDDPTWTNPLWWRYNILRHRYLEPLHPDDLDILGEGRFTDALLNLTGISTRDALFNERNRALREVASLLRRQLAERDYDEELCRIAVEELYVTLSSRPAARKLLGIAATFRSVFPRTLLLEMATREGVPVPEASLDDLIAHRFLMEGDGGANLLLPPALQVYVHARQPAADRERRHRLAARFFLHRADLILVAWHLRLGGRPAEATDVLLEAAGTLVEDLRGEELREALEAFEAHDLSSAQWSEVQMLLSDLWWRVGDRARALQACRQALKAAEQPVRQALAYHRMGKLYEDHDPIRAAGYYQQAAQSFPSHHPARAEVLKDHAWISIHQQDWDRAEADLEMALRIAETGPDNEEDESRRRRADIHNALASLRRQLGDHESALAHARQALVLREAIGDPSLVADSCNNIGLIYEEMGQLDAAITTYEEGLEIYRRLNQRERIATARLNIGGAHYYAGRLSEAVTCYRESLALFQEIGLPRGEAQARYNLAEALAALDDLAAARHQWEAGYRLSQQRGLDDQVRWFVRLRDDVPALRASSWEEGSKEESSVARSAIFLPAERVALHVARQAGHVRTKVLIEAADISRATAKRVLGRLVDRGLLVRVGKGRATCYVIPL